MSALLIRSANGPCVKRDDNAIGDRLIKSLEADLCMNEVFSRDRTKLLEVLGIPTRRGERCARATLGLGRIISIDPTNRLGAANDTISLAVRLGMRFEVDEIHAGSRIVDAF